MNTILAWIIVPFFLLYITVELGWGGGSPNHKDHNPPPGGV